MSVFVKNRAGRLVGLSLVAITSIGVVLSGAAASTAAPKSEQEATLEVLSPDQYAERYGVEAAHAVESAPTAELPPLVRLKSADGKVSKAIPRAELLSTRDPGGGNDGRWWSVVWGGKDLKGTYVPLRLGNSALGYRHYSTRHNLTTLTPFKASLKSHGPNGNGQYVAWVVNTGNGRIHEDIRFPVQLATRTQDGQYTTPDGAYIGVITGFCQGKNRCPNWVNQL